MERLTLEQALEKKSGDEVVFVPLPGIPKDYIEKFPLSPNERYVLEKIILDSQDYELGYGLRKINVQFTIKDKGNFGYEWFCI